MASESRQKYVLMHKNVPVVDLELDIASGSISEVGRAQAEKHVPIGIPVRKEKFDRAALNAWWTNRTIPESRPGIQDALTALNVSATPQLSIKNLGLSLSDQHWIRPAGFEIKWNDVNFFENPFSEDIGNVLFGKDLSAEKVNFMSPDSTTDGWLKKKWLIIDGGQCLIKGGSGATQQEPYNEVLASRIMDRLKIPHASYRLIHDDSPYCICANFITSQTELVPARYLVYTEQKPNHVSIYRHYLNCCEALGIPGIADALDHMIVLDYLIANEDRHLNNFGAIRNAETLEWIGAAPIYDSGSSLWFSNPTALIGSSGRLICKPFKSSHEEQIKLVTSFDWLDLSALKEIDEEFREILKGSIFINKRRCDALCSVLRKRVKMLSEVIKSGKSRLPVDDLGANVTRNIAYSGEQPNSEIKG